MQMKLHIFVGVGLTIGSLIGSYVPVLFGIDSFSYTSLLTGTIGSIIGIFVGYRVGQQVGAEA